jgi:hypothetical protein
MSRKIIVKDPNTGKVNVQHVDDNGVGVPAPTLPSKLLNLGQSFPAQCKFTEDTSRYLVAQCSRRAGKSTALAIRFLKTLATHPNSQCIYLSLTRESAIAIMWPVLIELNDKYDLGCTFTESKLTMQYPNGSKLRLIGADQKNFVKRLKGIKSPGIAIDEAQDFSSHLESLVDDVLTPMMTDYKDSWLAITGTPGPVPQGYFFEITQEKKHGYSFHEWTLLDNPYLPDAQGFIQQMIDKRGWKEDHPSLQREWRNKWVLDREALWIKYYPEVCDFQALPNITPNKWNYVMGIDLGFRDADAIGILAWSDKDPNTYLVEEVITKKQGLTELVAQIKSLQIKYDICKMVIDEGGLGKKLAEEMRRQHGIPVEPADKLRKQENVEFLNDSLRLGKFKAQKTSQFATDSYKVQIDWEKSSANRIVIKKVPHSDIIDAVLYAARECPAWSFEKEAVKPKWGTKEWAEMQSTLMFESAQEHFANEAELIRRMNGESD